MMQRKQWTITLVIILFLAVLVLSVFFYSNRKFFIVRRVESVELNSPIDNKHIVTSDQKAIRVLKKCLRKTLKNNLKSNSKIEYAPIPVSIEFRFANGEKMSQEYEVYHSEDGKDRNPFGEFFDLFPEQNNFSMVAYANYWDNEDIKEKVYSTIDEYTQVESEKHGYDVVEENIELYNLLAEIDDAVPYILKYALEKPDTPKAVLAVAIANRLLNKDVVVDDLELPQDFWCFFEKGTPQYYAARRVAAENR